MKRRRRFRGNTEQLNRKVQYLTNLYNLVSESKEYCEECSVTIALSTLWTDKKNLVKIAITAESFEKLNDLFLKESIGDIIYLCKTHAKKRGFIPQSK